MPTKDNHSTGDQLLVGTGINGPVPSGLKQAIAALTEKRLTTEETSNNTFVEFVLMSSKGIIDDIVKALLGPDATIKTFIDNFGVDLYEFIGFFVEVGEINTLTGPIIAGEIAPILILRETKIKTVYKTQIIKTQGLLNHDRQAAWIKRDTWENLIGA